MKIVRLTSNNVMRLVAVDVTPHGDLVVVGGKNGAGKSSVLDSIAMALGGAALAPPEPIRTGEAEAKIVVDLGELKVTRKFNRVKVHQAECASRQVNTGADGFPRNTAQPPCDCTPGWSDTTSTLSVTNAEGTAKYGSPQAMLDGLLGKLTFDPLEFANDRDRKRQAATLRALVGLDTRGVDDRRRAAAERRLQLKKGVEAKVAIVASMPWHDGAVEVPMQAITDAMQKAEEYRRLAEEAERWVEKHRGNGEQLARQHVRLKAEYEAIEVLLIKKGEELAKNQADIDINKHDHDAAKITSDAARAVVPDAAIIRAKLTEAEQSNAKARANAARVAVQAEAERLNAEHDLEHEAIVKLDEEKAAMLAAAQFPVAGLGVDDDGVTFNGLPFRQASTSEQLRVSVAVGLALNPKIKVLLVRNGNALDEDSLKNVAEQAEAADAQVWVEWVTKNADGVGVFVEDGKSLPTSEKA